MTNVRTSLSAASFVLFPLLVFMYWLLYPAYGLLDPAAILRAINGHASMTRIANAFGVAGAFMSVPAALALMAVLRERAPRLAFIGAAMTLVGWIALVGAFMIDVIAAEFSDHGGVTEASLDLFQHIAFSPMMIVLNTLALFHLLGGIVTGVALYRTGLVPRWVAVAAIVTHPIHLASNLGGLLWLDELTWIALAIAYGYVARDCC